MKIVSTLLLLLSCSSAVMAQAVVQIGGDEAIGDIAYHKEYDESVLKKLENDSSLYFFSYEKKGDGISDRVSVVGDLESVLNHASSIAKLIHDEQIVINGEKNVLTNSGLAATDKDDEGALSLVKPRDEIKVLFCGIEEKACEYTAQEEIYQDYCDLPGFECYEEAPIQCVACCMANARCCDRCKE